MQMIRYVLWKSINQIDVSSQEPEAMAALFEAASTSVVTEPNMLQTVNIVPKWLLNELMETCSN